MSAKSKRKARATIDRPAKPSSRLVTREVVEADPDGVRVVHHRVVDTLGRMFAAGTIDGDMLSAARDFEAAFTLASFDRMPSASLVLVHAPGTGVGSLSDRQIGAREHVFRALDALGGMGSPAGSCVWHVVGMQASLREWSMRQGWGGRAVRHEAAQGILVAALGVLVGHRSCGRRLGTAGQASD
ncbi:hypothetical protein C2U72_10505 [Prosthecomicrobium hirschii]|uniref:hypothetical protein n=1 Tax=Prosthecodimorpha hirschii TaxID=665126 RepID=UPI0011274762|nr:hypothetical protein [Prosthecomicrobium hirschii]TPQ51016.1 hypothetical protein C2U72_10505 [Prosthecomicrobium hirschii]